MCGPVPGLWAAITSLRPISTKCVFQSRPHRTLFSPPRARSCTTSPGQDATLSSGQYFAVFRLVLHVRGGAELDKDLVLEQIKGK